MNDRPEPDALLDQALRWLARREYSVHELEHRLLGKGYSPPAVTEALALLQSRDQVSDRRFAESLARSRVERGYGPMKITHELRARGIDDALIDQVLDDDGDRWMARLRDIWQKRFGQPPRSYKEWARQARGLQSRGFTAKQVRRVIPDIES